LSLATEVCHKRACTKSHLIKEGREEKKEGKQKKLGTRLLGEDRDLKLTHAPNVDFGTYVFDVFDDLRSNI
jgi:hypothetical protein